MKKFILIAASVSALCAGPVITPLVDYDKQDAIAAEKEVEQKLIIPLQEQPLVTTPGIRQKTFNYAFNLLAGRNYADSSSLVKDATTLGIRLNRYITDDFAIQIGYDRIFDADYKFKKNLRTLRKTTRTGEECPPCPPCETTDTTTDQTNNDTTDSEENNVGDDTTNTDNTGTDDIDTGESNNGSDIDIGNDTGDDNSGNNDTGSDNNNNNNDDGSNNGNNDNNSNDNNIGNDNGSGDAGSADNGGNISENPISQLGTKNGAKSTDIDRFYINALKEVHPEDTNFIPYFFAGVGYEHVNDKNLGIESQGFFNTGGGLKYSLNEKLRLISEAKIIKKFKDNDLDVVAMLGIGILFGEKTEMAIAREEKTTPEIEPKPENQDLTTIIVDEEETNQSPARVKTELPSVKPIERVKLDINELQHSGDYYIQIAAVSTEKSLDNYVNKLEKHNLHVVVKTVTLNHKNIYRILVGPYMDRKEAATDLSKARTIEKGAFIKKIP